MTLNTTDTTKTDSQELSWHNEQTANILKSFNKKLQQAIRLLNTKNTIKNFFIRKIILLL